MRHLFLAPLVRGYTWAYFAASALIGFEGVEAIFGVFIFAPEFVPVALLLLGIAWVFKSRIRRVRRLFRLYRLRRRVRGIPWAL